MARWQVVHRKHFHGAFLFCRVSAGAYNGRMSKHTLFSAALSLSLAASVMADNWPSWRGPNDDGSAVGGKYPVKLNDEAQWAWRVALPGKGCSTPIVWGDHIVLTAPVEGKDALLAFDWKGKLRWRAVLGREKPGKHRNGSGSNSSAVTDGSAFFVFFKSKTLAVVDFKGKVIWQKDLSSYGRDSLYWDFGTSPVLTQKHVVMALMREGNSWLLAFDKRTGELAWKAARNYKTPRECDHSYATPLVTRQGGREALLVWGAERLTAHDAADGKILWSCAGFNPRKRGNWVVVSSFVKVGDMAVVPYGRGSKLAGIKLDGKGDVTASHRAWEMGASSFVPTPAAHGGRVYTVRDRGEVLCTNPKTGETIWKGQFPKDRASYYSSPSIGDGKIYSAREDGTVFVAQIDGGFKLLSENDMGERIIASPVPVNSMLLLRGEKHLFCIKGK